MRRADGEKAQQSHNAACKKQSEQDRNTVTMPRQVPRSLNEHNTISDKKDRIKPKLTIIIGLAEVCQRPRIYGQIYDGCEKPTDGFDAKQSNRAADKDSRNANEIQTSL